jgi:hypothetical protein
LPDALKNATAGEVITIDSNVTTISGFTTPLKINKQVTIETAGQSVTVDSGTMSGDVFEVSAAGVIMNGLTIDENAGTTAGIAIDANDSLTLTGVTFNTGQNAIIVNAGAVLVADQANFNGQMAAGVVNNGGTVSLSGSTFTNVATGIAATDAPSTAVFATTFTGGSAAIEATEGAKDYVWINNDQIGNTSQSAIDITQTTSTAQVLLDGVSFTGVSHGALTTTGNGVVTLLNSKVENNETLNTSGLATPLLSFSGGAQVAFNNFTMSGNQTEGSAVVYTADQTLGGSLSVVDSTFSNNSAQGNSPISGGVLAVTLIGPSSPIGSPSPLVIQSSTFNGNTVDGNGGAVAVTLQNSIAGVAPAQPVIAQSTFSNNQAAAPGGKGGALFVAAPSGNTGVLLTNTTFTGNQAINGADTSGPTQPVTIPPDDNPPPLPPNFSPPPTIPTSPGSGATSGNSGGGSANTSPAEVIDLTAHSKTTVLRHGHTLVLKQSGPRFQASRPAVHKTIVVSSTRFTGFKDNGSSSPLSSGELVEVIYFPRQAAKTAELSTLLTGNK